MLFVVSHRIPNRRSHRADWCVAESLHDASHTCAAGRAGSHDRDGLLDVNAVPRMESIEVIEQVLPALLEFGCQFEHVNRSDCGVLVTTVVSRHEADRFFRGKHEFVGAVAVDLKRDVLETDQHVADDFHSVMLPDRGDEWRGDERLDDEVVGCQRAIRRAMAQHMVGQQRTELVPGETDIFAGSISHRDRHPIGIGIRREDQFGSRLLGVRDRGAEDFEPFGIRQLIGDVRKGAIERALWLEDRDAVKTKLLHDAIDRRLADAMQRRVQRGDISRYRKTLETNGSRVSRVHALAQQFNSPVTHSLLEIDGRNCGGDIDARDDPRIVRRQNLASRGPVRFEAIVRRRVVRGRDHDAGLTTLGDHRERQLGRGARFGEVEDLETMCRQHTRRPLRELTRPMP